MSALHDLSATELVAAYARRELSPVEVAQAVLAHIDHWEPHLGATWAMDPDGALAMARASEARWRRGEPAGSVDGVPTMLKENIATQGVPVPLGTAATKLVPAAADAPPAARLREAGAVFLGKTTMPDYGMLSSGLSSFHRLARNPWDLRLNPGGSSSGAGAGAAAGYGPLHLGTDIGGSVRLPASWCGIFTLKPSLGRIPIYPPYAGRVAGPMTRSVEDACLMMNVISQPDARDWHSLPYDGTDYTAQLGKGIKGLKIAFSPTLGYVNVDPEIARLVRAAVDTLQDLGASVEEVDPGFEDPAACFRTLWWAGARSLLGRLPPAKRKLLDPTLAEVVEQAKSITLDDYQEAVRIRGLLGSRMRQFMTGYDLLVTPTLPIPAFEAGQLSPQTVETNGKWVNWTPFSYPFNLTQQPAASVPCGFTSHGLPAGLHLVGRMFDDRTVLNVAHAYEQATEWQKARPPGC